MTVDRRSLLNTWFEFFDSVRTQILAALVVGLPADEVRKLGEPDARQKSEGGLASGPTAAGGPARRYWDDAPGTMTRNGLGSLEVGAFRDRSND